MASLGSIKVQHILWDSDKDPFGFNQWLSEFSDMVRALKGGEVLELFLDEKLKRLMRHASMVSKILLDDGDFLNEEVTKALAEAKSSSASIVTTTKTLGEATVKYSDFSAEVVTLDKQLYSVMRQCIKGSRKAIIENVVVHSYVQAVCVFHQHINLSASDRKIRALESLSTLKYTGDTHLFQIESTKRIKELMDSRCQMEDWILFSLMKAFGHSNENIQYRRHYCKGANHLEKECNQKRKDQQTGTLKKPDAKGMSKDEIRAQIKMLKKAAKKVTMVKFEEIPSDDEEPDLVSESEDSEDKSEDESIDLQDELEGLINLLDKPQGKPRHSRIAGGTVLSLCDGISCLAKALTDLGAKPERYIGVESNAKARQISEIVNPPSDNFVGVDRSWHNDVFDITEESIRKLGKGKIGLFSFGACCEDMSKLRLLPRGDSKKHDPDKPKREGLRGPKGKVLVQCLKVASWVRKYNPDCEEFSENVVFTDMHKDWQTVCEHLGEPYKLNAADYSFTKRNRAYWVRNIDIPEHFSSHHKMATPVWTQVAGSRSTLHITRSVCIPSASLGRDHHRIPGR